MGKVAVLTWGWLVVFAVGAFLRLGELGEMPVHADESTGARILCDSITGNRRAFDPTHFHGPLLPMLGRAAIAMAGEHGWQDVRIETLRLVPAFAGCLTVLVPLLLVRFLGPGGSLLAGALLATSPTLVYYNRVYIHESLLVLLSVAGMALVPRFLSRPAIGLGAIVGALIGLMWATKITAAIIWISWAGAALATLACTRTQQGGPGTLDWLRGAAQPLAGIACTALATAVVMFSDGFRNLAGIVDAIRTFFVYTVTDGHGKPLYYYVEWLLKPRLHLPFWDWEGWILAPVLMALVAGFLRPSREAPESGDRQGRGLAVFIATSFLIQLCVYSLINYKTPWLMLLPVACLCLLGPAALAAVPTRRKGLKSAITLLLIIGLLTQINTALAASRRFVVHPANPRAYVATQHSVKGLPDLVRGFLGNVNPGDIVVAGNHYWPLPWYLKSLPQAAYIGSLDASAKDKPLVICMPDQFAVGEGMLQASHIAIPLGLRLDYPIILHVRNDLWEARSESRP